MVNARELKAILKEKKKKKIHFYSYWNRKRLLNLVNEHKLLPEKSKDPKYERLKTTKNNPRKVSLEDIETGEIKTFPSIYKAAKFIDQSPQTISYWDSGVWKNKYKVEVQ